MAGHGGSSTVPKYVIGPRAPRSTRIIVGGLFLVSLLALLLLLVLSYEIAAGVDEPESLWDPHPEELKDLYHLSDVVQYVFLVSAVLAALVYAGKRFRRGSRAMLYLATGLAVAVLLIALATYAPCGPSGNPVVPVVGWAIGILEGDVEIAGPGARCSLAFSPGFELARGLAVVVAVWALSVVVRAVMRRRIEFWRTTASSDLDIVVGLDATTLPLIKALAVERDERSEKPSPFIRRPPWSLRGEQREAARAARHRNRDLVSGWEYFRWQCTGLRKGDLRRRLQPMTTVAVIDPEGSDHYREELRKLSVRVITEDPDDPGLMRLLVINNRLFRKPRLALRRMYVVTPDQQLNLRVYAKAREVLTEAFEAKPHVHDVVPRLIIRLDDEREARQWRLEQLEGDPGRFLADSITPEGVAAIEVAEEIIPPENWLSTVGSVERVLIVGESQLAGVLLDELAWQLWTRYEIAVERYRRCPGDAEQARRDLEDAALPRLRRVSLLGPSARIRALEWKATRPPWRLPTTGAGVPELQLFAVDDPSSFGSTWRDYQTRWEDIADEAFRSGERSAVVFVDDSNSYRAAASRLSAASQARGAQPDHQSLVVLRVAGTTTNREPVTRRGIIRFSPSLAVLKSTPGVAGGALRPLPPPGWVMRLAKQQHEVHSARWPASARDSDAEAAPADERRLTTGAWDDLHWFFRDDVAQQHWTVLNAYSRWQRVTAVPDAALPPRDLAKVAEAEAKRWRELRRRTGWWQVGDEDRWDRLRMTPQNLDERSARASDQDVEAAQQILDRLWATGYTPVVDDE